MQQTQHQYWFEHMARNSVGNNPVSVGLSSGKKDVVERDRSDWPQKQRGMKLLVIEDDERMADFISRGLKEHGHIVDLANNGKMPIRLHFKKWMRSKWYRSMRLRFVSSAKNP